MIETELSLLRAAIEANTIALREILDAGSAPPNVVPMKEEPKPAKEKPLPRRRTTPITEIEDGEELEPVIEETPETQAPTVETDTPTDVDAVIAEIIETFKAKMTAADGPAKAALKDAFPVIRVKWGLKPDDKLAALRDKPENLVGLLDEVKNLP